MSNPYKQAFDNTRQQSERTQTGANKRLSDIEQINLRDDQEDAAKRAALYSKKLMLKLKELISQHPGISKKSLFELGNFQVSPEKELKLLSQLKVIEWRKNGYFRRDLSSQ